MLIEMIFEKLIVANVILAFLDHPKRKTFFVGQTRQPPQSATPFQNLCIRPCQLLVDTPFIDFRYITKDTDRSIVFLVSSGIFFKNQFYISIVQLLWKSTCFNSAIKIRLKNLEKISELFLIILVGTSSLLVTFEASKTRISLQISSIVTSLKEKQSEEFLASLILRTLVWWEKFSIALTLS